MKRTVITFIFLTLLASILACRMSFGGKTPQRNVPVSTEALEQLESTLSSASQPFADSITITITEEQLTSYVALRLANNPDFPIQNPQILFQNGQIEIYGQVEQNGMLINASMFLQVYPDEYGNLKAQITSLDLGPISAPPAVQQQFNESVNQVLSDTIASETSGFNIQSITIGDGKMVIVASKQPN